MNRLKNARLIFGILLISAFASSGNAADTTTVDTTPGNNYYEAYASWDDFSYQYFNDTYYMRNAFAEEMDDADSASEESDPWQPQVYSYTTLSTWYPWDSMQNCMLTCQFWNGRIFPALSTIDFMGTMIRENGYEGMVEALCIVDVDAYGNAIKGYEIGGGICASAVAAGNAADGQNIVSMGTEHTERSIYVRPEDDDFTVSEGVVDLYLVNYTNYDYRINMWVNPDWTVTCVYTPVITEDLHPYTQEPDLEPVQEYIWEPEELYDVGEEYPYMY